MSNPTARYSYDAFGNQTTVAGGSANALGYTGQRLDGETGLMPLGNGTRYYSPGLGRFIQQDSWTGLATMAQSMNRYAYGNGNPTKYTDPTGHYPWEGTQNSTQYGYTPPNFSVSGEEWKNLAYNLASGAINGAINIVLEPLRQVADIVTAAGTRAMGIDAEYVQLSSMLGRSQQEQILAGESKFNVVLGGVKTTLQQAAIAATGPAGIATAVTVNAIVNQVQLVQEYANGNLTTEQYDQAFAKQLGEDVGAPLVLAGVVGAASRGFGRARAGLTRESGTAIKAESRALKSGKESASYANSRMFSSGEFHAESTILDAFREARHTKVSKAILERIENGNLKVEFTETLKNAGTTRSANEIKVNQTMRLEDILSTIVHEGQHALDIKNRIIPSPAKATPFNEAVAELRAFSAQRDFVKLNDFQQSHMFQFRNTGPVELMISISDGYKRVGTLSDKELLAAITAAGF